MGGFGLCTERGYTACHGKGTPCRRPGDSLPWEASHIDRYHRWMSARPASIPLHRSPLDIGILLYTHGRIHPAHLRVRLLSPASRALLVYGLPLLGIGGASSAYSPSGYPNSTPRNAAQVRLRSPHLFSMSLPPGQYFAVGAAVARYGTLGWPVAVTGLAFMLGLALLPLGYENTWSTTCRLITHYDSDRSV